MICACSTTEKEVRADSERPDVRVRHHDAGSQPRGRAAAAGGSWALGGAPSPANGNCSAPCFSAHAEPLWPPLLITCLPPFVSSPFLGCPAELTTKSARILRDESMQVDSLVSTGVNCSLTRRPAPPPHDPSWRLAGPPVGARETEPRQIPRPERSPAFGRLQRRAGALCQRCEQVTPCDLAPQARHLTVS